MADKAPVTDRLQRQADGSARAQEKIDRDPEEAYALLRPAAAISDGSPLTLKDVFGLFVQLQQQQAAFQQQLVEVLTHQQRQEQRTQHATAEELERSRKKREATIEAWRIEPRESVWIQPNIDEERIATVMNGEMPPRNFHINGIDFPIKVGEIVEVPHSVAELVRRTQRKGPLNRPHQAIPHIADPQRGQFLAGSQEISPGNPGKAGEGALLLSHAATSAEAAGPLEERYDAWGR